MSEYLYDVFISYSHADQKWVRGQLLPRLEHAGLKVMIDYRDFKIGMPGLINMKWAVDNSSHTLLVLSPAWVASQWAGFESLLASTADPASLHRKLIPLILAPCELPRRIAMLEYADLTDPATRDGEMSRLVHELTHEAHFPTSAFDRRSMDSKAVQMCAYYPSMVSPNTWHPFLAYIYRMFAAQRVIEDARSNLGGRRSLFDQVTHFAGQPVAQGAQLCVTPQLKGFQFNPLNVTIGLYEDWHRLDFRLCAIEAPLNQSSSGSITFAVEGVVVADIPVSIDVSEREAKSETKSETVKPYDKIFCSYSHKDVQIVERVETACRALGLDYLRDVYTLRSGERWNCRLLELIEVADIFQLFWSIASAGSQAVKQEWQHAVRLQDKPSNFIRPVYWQKPMPTLPSELAHIHFSYQPGLAD